MNGLWAVSYTAFKALSPWLDAGGVATLRFGLAAVALLVCWPWLPGAAPQGRDAIRCSIMGIIVFVLAPRLQVAGVQLSKATDASVLMPLEPLVTSVGAAVFLREHIAPRRWMGLLLGFGGVLAVAGVWQPGFRLPALAADFWIVLSYFCEAAYSLMGKPILERAGLFKVLGLALLAGTAANLLIDGRQTILAAASMPRPAWLIMAYLSAVCTLVGYSLWFAVIQHADVNVVALTIFVQPLVSVGVAMAWLGESLRWGQLWGSLIIVTGLTVGLPRPSDRKLSLRSTNSAIP